MHGVRDGICNPDFSDMVHDPDKYSLTAHQGIKPINPVNYKGHY